MARREELLIRRYPLVGRCRKATPQANPEICKEAAQEIDKYSVGDNYYVSFTTYVVTRKDREGLWGRWLEGPKPGLGLMGYLRPQEF